MAPNAGDQNVWLPKFLTTFRSRTTSKENRDHDGLGQESNVHQLKYFERDRCSFEEMWPRAFYFYGSLMVKNKCPSGPIGAISGDLSDLVT